MNKNNINFAAGMTFGYSVFLLLVLFFDKPAAMWGITGGLLMPLVVLLALRITNWMLK